jgi:hypothetical protein
MKRSFRMNSINVKKKKRNNNRINDTGCMILKSKIKIYIKNLHKIWK